MAKAKKSGLGRGLSALMGDALAEKEQSVSKTTDQAVSPNDFAPEPSTEGAVLVESVEAPEIERTDLTAGQEYIASEQAAEQAEQAVVTQREARTEELPLRGVMQPVGDSVEIKGIVDRERTTEGHVPLSQLIPNPDQPRTHFKKEEIEELANSIEKEGLLQPILVRKVGENYQIIAGERRYQACKQIGLSNVPVRIMDATDDKAVEIALVENIQRVDLNPIEEAYGYKRMMERKGMTQAEVAQAVSKGRSTVANALRLLDLPEAAQQLLYEERITAGHARAILSIPTREGREKLTTKLSEKQLSVRETEALARLISGVGRSDKTKAPKESLPAYFKTMATSIRERLNTPVRVRTVGGKNKLEIEFKDENDLKRVVKKLLDD